MSKKMSYLLGILFAIANILIIGTVIKHPVYRQRKEMWMICALAIADIVNPINMLMPTRRRI